MDHNERGLKEELILSLADNTSAICWVYRTSLSSNEGYYKAVNFIARKVATLVWSSSNFLETQHIPGDKNDAADWLIFEGEERIDYDGNTRVNPIAYDCPSNDELTHRFHSKFSHLIPKNFRISHLPPEIFSFANQSVQILESSMTQRQKGVRNCTTGSGEDGKASAKRYCVGRTLPLIEYQQKGSQSSFELSSNYTENPSSPSQERLLENVGNRWRESLSKKPRSLWLRRSATILGGVPFTKKGDYSRELKQDYKDLLKAYDNATPNKKLQKAITPDLLRCMAQYASFLVINDAEDHAIDLVIGSCFFAMRSCKISKTPTPGKTKMITLSGVKFFTANKTKVDHQDPHLIEKSTYVWILFEDQKNRDKFDTRTQNKTNDPLLCPVLWFGRAVQRVYRFLPSIDDLTPLCSINFRRSKFVTQTQTCDLLRKTCEDWGGESRFGFNAKQIGNKSFRSGAAMALFLKNHSSDKIMILGRWKSKAFLDYIRPQKVEWTDLFSEDMISFENFFELFVHDPKKKVIDELCKKHLEIPELCMEF